MRKLLLLAAMLAMVMVAAAPAMAQTATAGDSGNFTSTSVLTVDASQSQNATATQFGGDAVASGDSSAASVNNDLSIHQTQVNGGFGFYDGDLNNDGILDQFEFFSFVY